jgi:hypothetical protein
MNRLSLCFVHVLDLCLGILYSAADKFYAPALQVVLLLNIRCRHTQGIFALEERSCPFAFLSFQGSPGSRNWPPVM